MTLNAPSEAAPAATPTETPAATIADPAKVGSPAAAATGSVTPSAEPAKGETAPEAPLKAEEGKTAEPAKTEPAAWSVDWKAIVGEDAEALKLVGDYKAAADLLADLKKAKADWRDVMSGGDENLRKVLERWNDPVNAGKAYVSMRAKMGDATYVKKPDAKASPEEVAEFRKAMGVPDEPKGYKINFPEGTPEQSDLDKAIVENFLAVAHAAGFTQEQVDNGIAAFEAGRRLAKQHNEEAIKQIRQDNEDTLRLKWGNEYRGNLDLAKRFLNEHMNEFGSEDFLELKLESGARIGDFLPFVEWASQMGRNMYGSGPLINGDGQMSTESIEEEYRRLTSLAGTEAYRDPKVQKRVMELARIRTRGRAA